MAYTITLLPGDGIGPEVTDATLRVLEATGLDFDWDEQTAGMAAYETGGDPLPEAVIDSIRRNKIALKGPLTTPVGTGFRSANVKLRQVLDLFANVRPCVSLPNTAGALREHRPHHLPREHRGPLRRDRVLRRAQPDRRLDRARDAAGVGEDHPFRVRAG